LENVTDPATTSPEEAAGEIVARALNLVAGLDSPAFRIGLEEYAASLERDTTPEAGNAYLAAHLALSLLGRPYEPPPLIPVLAGVDLSVFDDVTAEAGRDYETAARIVVADCIFNTREWTQDRGELVEVLDCINNAVTNGHRADLVVPGPRSPRLGFRPALNRETRSTCALTEVPFEIEANETVPCLHLDNGETADLHPLLVGAGPTYVVAAGINAAAVALSLADVQQALDVLALVSGLHA
jgi:hypothetical protein